MLVVLMCLHALQLSSYSQIKVIIHVFQLSGKILYSLRELDVDFFSHAMEVVLTEVTRQENSTSSLFYFGAVCAS